MLVRDQEVGGSNPLAPTKFLKDLQTSHIRVRVQTGSVLDPTLTRALHSGPRCRRVLNRLPSDDFDDPLGPYQEVLECTAL